MSSEKGKTCELSVNGMHCESCELFVEQAAKKQKGVISVKADKKFGNLKIVLQEGILESEFKDNLEKELQESSYSISGKVSTTEQSSLTSYLIAAAVIIIFIILQKLNIVELYSPEQLTPFAILTIGGIASISSCMAVVGALVLSFSSKLPSDSKKSGILSFHVSRIVSFVIFGGILGLLFAYFGQYFRLSNSFAGVIEVIIATILMFVGLDMLGLKLPKITLPKQLGESVFKLSSKNTLMYSILAGALTFFLPCGFTQSMQFQAAASGSFLRGAEIMGLFALGTLPMLLLMSFTSASATSTLRSGSFAKAMGVIIVFFALLNIIGAGVKLGIIPLWINNILY